MLLLRPLVALALGWSFAARHIHAHSLRRDPLNYLSLVEDAEILTSSRRVNTHSSFDLTFSLHRKQQRIKLRLEPNHDLIPPEATVEYVNAQGAVTRVEKLDRQDYKVFRGHAWVEGSDGAWTNAGWARIVIRRDGRIPLFEGAFTLGHDDHHIQLRSNYLATKHERDPHAEESDDEYMVVFRDSDMTHHADHAELRRSAGPDLACQADRLAFNARPDHPVYSTVVKRDAGVWGVMPVGSLLGKRQIDGTPGNGNSAGINLRNSIGRSEGCPNTRRVALVGVAMDCLYISSFNSSDTARANVINQMNSASTAYERAFNITLGLTSLITDENCPGTGQPVADWNQPCTADTTIQDRLNAFSRWRGTRNDSNSHWTLLTRCSTGTAVGLAWLGQVCVSQVQDNPGPGGTMEYVSGANVVSRTATEWQVIAHETGHTFGAVHDCTADLCADGTTVAAQQCCPLAGDTCSAGERFIMNPATSQGISEFSACSIGNVCSAIGRNSVNSDCLSANREIQTITGNQCGNGIVEAGEECDCGGEANCGDNACCEATTCRFKSGARCDDANEDCCNNCQFAPRELVCRASTGECDPEERCTGDSPTCPPDQTRNDGDSCGNGSLRCASGQCTSRDEQCKTLMGSFTQSNVTYACDSSNCQLSCASPEFGDNVCYGMQQNFLDGTPCGGGGRCRNGQCRGSSAVGEIGSWISRNRNVVIGVASGLGGLLLISLLCCVYGCLRRRKSRRRQQRQRKPTSSPPWSHPPGNQGHTMGILPARGSGHGTGGARGSVPHWSGPLPPPVAYPTRATTMRYA